MKIIKQINLKNNESGIQGAIRSWPAARLLGRGRSGAVSGMLPGMLPVPLPLPAAFPGALEGTVGFGPPRPPPPWGCRAPCPARGGSGGCGSPGQRHRTGSIPTRAGLGTSGCRRARPGSSARDGAAAPQLPPSPGGSRRPYRNLKHPPTAQPFPWPRCLLDQTTPRRADDFSAERTAMQTSAINAFETIYDFRPTSTCISIYLVSLIYTLFFQNHKHSCWNFMWKCLRG